jgi:5-methylcytosine-specific restriction endonuclease McrA
MTRDDIREKRLERKREYYYRNRERILDAQKLYYESNKARVSECNRRWALAHPESRRAAVRAWKERNRERVREESRLYSRAYIAKDRLSARRRATAYAKKYPEKVAARKADYRHRNRERIYGWINKRNTLIGSGAKSPEIITHIHHLKTSTGVKCAYCGVVIFGKAVHIDHEIPLSRGGKHEISNLRPACKPCNSSKHNKMLHEWRGVEAV